MCAYRCVWHLHSTPYLLWGNKQSPLSICTKMNKKWIQVQASWTNGVRYSYVLVCSNACRDYVPYHLWNNVAHADFVSKVHIYVYKMYICTSFWTMQLQLQWEVIWHSKASKPQVFVPRGTNMDFWPVSPYIDEDNGVQTAERRKACVCVCVCVCVCACGMRVCKVKNS